MAIDATSGLSGLQAMTRGLEAQQGRASGLGDMGARTEGMRPAMPLGPVESQRGTDAVGAPTEGSFANVLSRAIGELEQTQSNADAKSMALVTGQEVAVHDVMAAVTEAEIAVQMTSAIAVKAIAAYQEIWRMEI